MSTAVSKPWPFWFHELFRTKKYQAYMKAKREAAWKAQEEEFARQERIAQQKREIAKQQRANDLMRQSQRVSLTAKHAASNKPASVPVSRSSSKQEPTKRRDDDDDGYSTYPDSWAPTHHRTPDPEPTYHGRGGSFDGGGASGDWDRSSSHSSSSHSSSSYDSGSSSSSSSDSGSSSSSSSSD
jgi:hypothetical protein